MKTKALILKMYFICITFIMTINTLKAQTSDSLKIAVIYLAPLQQHGIYVPGEQSQLIIRAWMIAVTL